MRSFFTLIILLGVFGSCSLPASGSQVWGMDPDDLSSELARSDYQSLRHVSFSRHRLEEAERLGEDATYALGLVYLELGIDDIGEQLLELAADRAPEPWRAEAYSHLLDRYREAERYEELAAHASREPDNLDARLALLEALYELDRYDEVEALMLESGVRIDGISAADPVAAEIALWWAIARVELDRPDWSDAIRALYRDHPASHPHSRVWVYLINRSELLDEFSATEIDVFRAKQLLAEGRAADAADIFSELAAEPAQADYLAGPWGLLDLYRSGVGSGRSSAAAEALRAIAGRSESDVAARALEYAGRIYRLAGAHAAAVSLLDESLVLLPPGPAEQRVRWYRLSSRMRQDPFAFADEIDAFVPLMSEPTYFGDLLFELAGLLAERQRWDAMLEVYEVISGFATPGTLARYELAIARAFELGLLAASPGRAAELRERYLERAYAQRENLFAALAAAALLGHDATELIALVDDPEAPGDPTNGDSPSDSEASDTEASGAELLADTYLRFGLVEQLSALLRTAGDEVSAATRIRAAERIARAGRIRESIVVLNRLVVPGLPVPRSVATMRYPLAFAAIMDNRIADEGIDPSLFYALIREESLFDPEIGSSAGATGLAQLMRPTAEDIARRMRLDDPDLLDPADSITIGARYFSMLSAQFGTPVRALAAYNAGQGNVRRWERRAPGLDDVLFHQTIPYPETYNHVRKVVVSAVYYGYLYEDRPPGDTVRAIFTLD
ncbi:MAG: flagellar assembly lytic transglycosylase [Spirochaetota bacterium]